MKTDTPASGPSPAKDHVLPRIDPRIARRWIEVRREQGRRRLHILTVCAAVTAVLAAGAGMLFSPLARVRHVRIAVSGPMTAAQVQTVAGLDHYKLMIDVNSAGIARRLDADPHLGAARVQRSWPATVRISVVVRTALAEIRTGSGWATVDPTGRVLADANQPIPGLPQLTGVGVPPAPGGWLPGSLGSAVPPGAAPGSEAHMNAASDDPSIPRGAVAALVALQALPAPYRSQVVTVSAPPSGDLTFSVLPANLAAGSIPVDFGDGSRLAAKLNSLIALLSKANLAGVESINLSVPDRPTALTAR